MPILRQIDYFAIKASYRGRAGKYRPEASKKRIMLKGRRSERAQPDRGVSPALSTAVPKKEPEIGKIVAASARKFRPLPSQKPPVRTPNF